MSTREVVALSLTLVPTLMAAGSCGPTMRGGHAQDVGFSAVVYGDSVRVAIPPGGTSQVWQRRELRAPTDPDCSQVHELQFGWLAMLEEVGSGYEWGAMDFNCPDHSPHSVPLSRILDSAYVDLWAFDTDRPATHEARYDEGFPRYEVSAQEETGYVIVTLRGEAVVQILFGSRPKELKVLRFLDPLRVDTTAVSVTYVR